MPWLNVDDGFADHPKVLELLEENRPALVCWLMCGVWSAKHMQNGKIPRHVALRHGSADEIASLVAARLFIEVDTGYEISGYLDANRSRAQVEADRAANRKRQRAYRDRNAVTNGVTNAAVTGLDGKKRKKSCHSCNNTGIEYDLDDNERSCRDCVIAA